MASYFEAFAASVRHAAHNPFGLDFHTEGKDVINIYVPLGSVINCLGYNDYLERIVGAARACFALLTFATTDNKHEKVLAAFHLLRALFEMKGDFEYHLLVADVAFTVVNIATKVLPKFSGSQSA